jgi:hypothetical protein
MLIFSNKSLSAMYIMYFEKFQQNFRIFFNMITTLHKEGRRQQGGRRGLQPPYCLRNKGTLL